MAQTCNSSYLVGSRPTWGIKFARCHLNQWLGRGYAPVIPRKAQIGGLRSESVQVKITCTSFLANTTLFTQVFSFGLLPPFHENTSSSASEKQHSLEMCAFDNIFGLLAYLINGVAGCKSLGWKSFSLFDFSSSFQCCWKSNCMRISTTVYVTCSSLSPT
jgi:hypothetical protein